MKYVTEWGEIKSTKRAVALLRVNLLGYMRRYDECEALIKEYCKEYPAAGAIEYANFLLSRDKPEEAIKVCKKAIDIEPERLRLYIICSEAYQKLANWEGAENILEEALETDPYRMDIKSSINALLIKQGKVSQARSRLIEEFKREKSMSYVPMMVAVSERTKDWSYTISACKALMEKGNTNALITYAKILTRTGKPKEALATLTEEGIKYRNNEKIQIAIEEQHIVLEEYELAKQCMLNRLSKREETLDVAKQKNPIIMQN